MKLLTHIKWGGLYDFNERTEELTKVLRCYHVDNSVSYDEFPYQYIKGDYREATKKDIRENAFKYFTKCGSKPFVKE